MSAILRQRRNSPPAVPRRTAFRVGAPTPGLPRPVNCHTTTARPTTFGAAAVSHRTLPPFMLEKRRAIWAWALIDWANSAFAIVVMTAFFPIFFKKYWSAVPGEPGGAHYQTRNSDAKSPKS